MSAVLDFITATCQYRIVSVKIYLCWCVEATAGRPQTSTMNYRKNISTPAAGCFMDFKLDRELNSITVNC